MGGNGTAIIRGLRGLCVERQPFPDERVMLFSVDGILDHATFEVMEAAIRSALKTGCSMLVLDLSRASEVSPSGVDGIVQSLAEIRERGGDLVLLNPAAAVKEVLKTLEALGLIRHITTVQSVEEAMDFFSVKLPSFASSRQT